MPNFNVEWFLAKIRQMPDDITDPYDHLDHGELKLYRNGQRYYTGDIFDKDRKVIEPEDYIARDWVPTLSIGGSKYLRMNVYMPNYQSEWWALSLIVTKAGVNPTDIIDGKTKKIADKFAGNTPKEQWINFLEWVRNEAPPN